MPFKSGQFSCHVPQHQGRTPAFHRKCNIVVHILKTKYSIYMNVKYESESTKPLCKVLMRKRQAAACLNGVDISPYRGKDHAASSARRSVRIFRKSVYLNATSTLQRRFLAASVVECRPIP